MCFAATHDIELTDLLSEHYDNYHFQKKLRTGMLFFLHHTKGKATSRNAIKLLEIIGYDKNIINKAEQRAERFIETGVWRN